MAKRKKTKRQLEAQIQTYRLLAIATIQKSPDISAEYGLQAEQAEAEYKKRFGEREQKQWQTGE